MNEPGSVPSAIAYFVSLFERGDVPAAAFLEYIYITLAMLGLDPPKDINEAYFIAKQIADAYRRGEVNDYTIYQFVRRIMSRGGGLV